MRKVWELVRLHPIPQPYSTSGETSMALGFFTTAKAYGGIAVGLLNNNTDAPNGEQPQPTDRIFQIGNGNGGTRSNAVTVLRNGNTGIGALDPTYRLDLASRMRILSGTTGGKLFGVTLVFSTIPIMRIVFSLMGANDEPWIIRHLFGNSTVAFWLMNIAIWLLTVPPLWLAWKTITNQPKIWIYLFYLLGLPIFVFLFVGIFLENLIVKYHILSDTLWGMPYLILLAEVLAYWGYYTHKIYISRAVCNQ